MPVHGSPDAATAPDLLSKVCTRCGIDKPADAFTRRRALRSGLQSACKDCVRLSRRARYHADPERHRALHHASYEMYGDTIRARAREARRRNPWPYNAKTRAWRMAHPDRVRANALRARMNITPAEYDRMLEEQDGRCAICRRSETVIEPRTGTPKRLSIDHDHTCCSGGSRTCGRCVRGLLCSRCNAALGFLGDDPDFLEAGARYLREHARRRATADASRANPEESAP